MDVLSGVRDNWFKLAASTLLVFAATCSGSAEDKLTGGPTPSPPGAAAHFLELKDGDTVPTKVTVRFGLREMGVAPAGLDRPNSGHHHLLIDTDLPPLNEPTPMISITFISVLARPRRKSHSNQDPTPCSCY
jgi:hypothetical protein